MQIILLALFQQDEIRQVLLPCHSPLNSLTTQSKARISDHVLVVLSDCPNICVIKKHQNCAKNIFFCSPV